jgi:hypothetical protein
MSMVEPGPYESIDKFRTLLWVVVSVPATTSRITFEVLS